MNSSARQVLQQYPTWAQGVPSPLGNHGGFSGAQLWRIDRADRAFCLKAWPTEGRSREELAEIHHWMAKAAGFPWLPRVVPTIQDDTLVDFQGRLWELITWMPGQADFASAPSAARLESACTVLAQLHVKWAESESSVGFCPGILRRWQSWRLWTDLLQSGWRPHWTALDPYVPIAEPLFHAVQLHLDELPCLLTPWLNVQMPLQPCVCDPWHDHILFTGDAVTGLIDFGSAKIDHVAVDLARLLGSLVGDDERLWLTGITAYRRLRPFSDDEHRLAHDLDRTGTLLAATHWLRWLYHEGRRYDQPAAVLERLRRLAARITFMSKAQGRSPLGLA